MTGPPGKLPPARAANPDGGGGVFWASKLIARTRHSCKRFAEECA
jgi:hypothetical protein